MFRTAGLAFSAFLVFLASCKSQTVASETDKKSGSLELVLADNYSGILDEELMLLKNEKELGAFFNRINRMRKPGLPLPEVDFEKYMLAVYCIGETTIVGIGLELAEETDGYYRFQKLIPVQTEENTAIISPFLMYKLPHNDKEIRLD